MIFLKKKRVELGDGHIIAHVVFEWKRLFSVIIYNWKTIRQNRFHTHAFPAVAFLLRGAYVQEVMDSEGIVTVTTVNQWLRPRWLPRNYCHRILTAEPHTWTIVFVGPWARYWFEFFPDTATWVKYTWGRKVVSKTESPLKESK